LQVIQVIDFRRCVGVIEVRATKRWIWRIFWAFVCQFGICAIDCKGLISGIL